MSFDFPSFLLGALTFLGALGVALLLQRGKKEGDPFDG